MSSISYNSPIGPLTIFEAEGEIVALEWGWPPEPDANPSPILEEAFNQLEAYFQGRLDKFNLPLAPYGTDFQKKVWAIMSDIPKGQTKTYAEVAEILGTSPRAVGSACGRNPLPILIPCHRILGAKGSLGGYSAFDGVESKKFLLELENAA